MLFNNRTANNNAGLGNGHQRGKSVGFNSFSFTGVRYFQPKFMSDLNKGSEDGGLKSVEKEKTSTKSINAQQVEDSKTNIFKNQSLSTTKSSTTNTDPTTSKQNIDPSLSSLSKFEKEKERKQSPSVYCKIRGLNNIGNTCYMNSSLQCLLNLSRFNGQMMEQLKQLSGNGRKMIEVSQQYLQIVKEFSQCPNTTISFPPSKFKSAIGKKKIRFVGNNQQDAQQFITSFFEIVNQELSRIQQKSKPKYMVLENNPNKKSMRKLSDQWWQFNLLRDNSIICDTFQGQMISLVTCKKCKNQSVTFDNIWGLPLSLNKTTQSIPQLIRTNWNMQSEITDYYCEVCKRHRECTKKQQFFKLPEVLIVQLKRFDFGKQKKDKVKTPVKLTETLNLKEFINANAYQQRCVYKLTAMVHHYGEVDYGHYTASVFKQKQKKWYFLNDSKPSQIAPDTPNGTVYLLFYERSQTIAL